MIRQNNVFSKNDLSEFACPTEKRTLHFTLKQCSNQDDLLVHANLRDYQIERHTPETLERASKTMPFLRLMPKDQVTHYIEDLPLPSTRPALVSVSMGTLAGKDQVRNIVAMYIHVPKAGLAAARAAMAKGQGNAPAAVPPKLAAYGMTGPEIEMLAGDPEFPDHVHNLADAHETAVALLFHHSSLLNLSTEGGGVIPALIKMQCIGRAIDHSGVLPATILDCGDRWNVRVPLLDEKGEPMHNDQGAPLYTMRLDRDVSSDMKGPLALAIKYSRQEERLRNRVWSVQDGIVSNPYGGSAGASFAQRKSARTADARWKLKNATPGMGLTVDDTPRYDSSQKKMSLSCKNTWLRHLGVYVQFVNAGGSAIAPPSTGLPDWMLAKFEGDATRRFLSWVGPIDEICGVPIGSEPTELTFPVPEEASSITLYWGGLGLSTGSFDMDVCLMGIVLTSVFELALPPIALCAGAAITSTQWFQDLLQDHKVLLSVLGVIASLGAAGIDYAVTHTIRLVLVKLANLIGPLLLKTGIKGALEKILAQGALELAIPYVDLAFEAFNAAVTAAELSQTLVEAAQAPPVYKTTISRTIDLNATLTADHRFHMFPPQATHYRVTVAYDSQATQPVQDFPLPLGTHSDPLRVSFQDIPAGGKLQVTAIFYASNGWPAGQGQTTWMDALGNNGDTLQIDNLEITNNEVPLNKQSIYMHLEKLVYNGAHAWQPGPAPTETLSSSTNRALQSLTGITLAQGPASIGYAWQATGLGLPQDNALNPSSQEPMYTAQNVSILEHPEQAYRALNVGYTRKAGICYDLLSKSDGSGSNFFVDANPDATGCFHFRQVGLSFDEGSNSSRCNPMVSGTGNSYGKFPLTLDDFVVHSQGYVFGISTAYSKLIRCEVAKSPVADAAAPEACILSGEGAREGLMLHPVAVAVGLDGVVMVLEAGNARVQAFDINGNPVKYFNNKTSYTLALHNRAGTNYLDMDVEAKGYVYVLSCINGGNSPSDFFMDIYTPEGSLLVTTPDIASGKLTVGLLRDVYALNYECLHGPSGRPEPSVSHWIPPAPA